MQTIRKRTKGEIFILLSATLWSFFPVVTILTFSAIPPLFSAALATLLAAVFFAFVLTLRNRWSDLKKSEAWKDMLLTTLYIGVLFYGLMFLGLKRTTAGNASILALMEVFFAFVLLGVFLRHEKLEGKRILGALCMAGGAALILLPKTSGMQWGDLLIILATMFAPMGNVHAQRARRHVSAETIMFVRSFLSGLFLLLLAMLAEQIPSPQTLRHSLGFLAVNGVLLLGFTKILWIEGINLIPITLATSFECITPALTLIIAAVLLHENISLLQVAGFVPIVAGLLLLTLRGRNI